MWRKEKTEQKRKKKNQNLYHCALFFSLFFFCTHVGALRWLRFKNACALRVLYKDVINPSNILLVYFTISWSWRFYWEEKRKRKNRERNRKLFMSLFVKSLASFFFPFFFLLFFLFFFRAYNPNKNFCFLSVKLTLCVLTLEKKK